MPETPRAEYKQAAGTPDQMEKGAASELNDALPPPTELAPDAAVAAQAPMEPEVPVEPALPADYAAEYVPEDEDSDFLTSPTTRPSEAEFVGSERRKGLSPAVRRNLQSLQEAAAVPGASAELKALVSYLLRSA